MLSYIWFCLIILCPCGYVILFVHLLKRQKIKLCQIHSTENLDEQMCFKKTSHHSAYKQFHAKDLILLTFFADIITVCTFFYQNSLKYQRVKSASTIIFGGKATMTKSIQVTLARIKWMPNEQPWGLYEGFKVVHHGNKLFIGRILMNIWVYMIFSGFFCLLENCRINRYVTH